MNGLYNKFYDKLEKLFNILAAKGLINRVGGQPDRKYQFPPLIAFTSEAVSRSDCREFEIDFLNKQVLWYTWDESGHNGDSYNSRQGSIPFDECDFSALEKLLHKRLKNALEEEIREINARHLDERLENDIKRMLEN